MYFSGPFVKLYRRIQFWTKGMFLTNKANKTARTHARVSSIQNTIKNAGGSYIQLNVMN